MLRAHAHWTCRLVLAIQCCARFTSGVNLNDRQAGNMTMTAVRRTAPAGRGGGGQGRSGGRGRRGRGGFDSGRGRGGRVSGANTGRSRGRGGMAVTLSSDDDEEPNEGDGDGDGNGDGVGDGDGDGDGDSEPEIDIDVPDNDPVRLQVEKLYKERTDPTTNQPYREYVRVLQRKRQLSWRFPHSLLGEKEGEANARPVDAVAHYTNLITL